MECQFRFLEDQNPSDIIKIFSQVSDDYVINVFDSGSYDLIKKAIGIKDDISFILSVNNRNIGFFLGAYRGNTAYISSMYIFKEFRSKGYGRIILQKAVSLFHEKECNEIRLEVIQENIKAVNLYKSEGFITDKEIFHFQNNKIPAHYEKNNYKIEKSDGYNFQPLFRYFHKDKRPWVKELRSLIAVIDNNIGILYLLKLNDETEGYIILSENKDFITVYDIFIRNNNADKINNIIPDIFNKGKIAKINSIYKDDPIISLLDKNGFYVNIKQHEMKKKL
jgi:ribosomal protein S18 acetylase RimI-like enzyme